MARQQGWLALLLALVIGACSVCFSYPFQLGLDFRGGSQLTLEVEPVKNIEQVTSEQVEAVKAVLDRRVNSLGVSESTLQTIGTKQLILELPGEQDPSKAEELLGKTALLEFRTQRPGTQEKLQALNSFKAQARGVIAVNDLNENNEKSIIDLNREGDLIVKALKEEFKINEIEGSAFQQIDLIITSINKEIAKLFEPSNLTGSDLLTAGRRQEQNSSSWEVTLSFSSEGGNKFASLTKSIAGTGRLLGIVLDGASISEASVGKDYEIAGITGGSATISSRDFTAKKAKDIEDLLRGGSLPNPVKVRQVRTIGPTLGEDNIKRSLFAALSGLFLVAIFMIIFYRLAGFVAVLALSFYALFNLSIYTLIPVTLTLPGIAGFILSIGMAVDANVLIFERIKDELRRGNTLIRSIESGFSSAFSSIIDGHFTTLISCICLFYLGTGFVKGFAATLGIGVLISLFTALSCTRIVLKSIMSYKSLRKTTNFLAGNQIPTTNL